MNKDKFILTVKYFDFIFFGLLAIVAGIRFISGISGFTLVGYFFQNVQFLFLPAFLCVGLYSVNQYYQNIFIKIRYKNEKGWEKNYLLDCIKISVLVVLVFYLDILLCCFEASFMYVLMTLILFIHSATIFTFLAQLNCFLFSKLRNKYSIYFILTALCLLFYLMLRFCYSYYSYLHYDGDQPYMWYICGLGILINFLLPFIHKNLFKLKALKRKVLLYAAAIVLFCLQAVSFRNLGGIESIGFPEIIFFSIEEIIFPLLLWIFQFVLLISIVVYEMFKNYRSHLLFYAIRITNRSRWFCTVFVKGMASIVVLLLFKYEINYYFDVGNLSLIPFMIESGLRTGIFALLIFLLYQIMKDIKLFGYLLICMMLIIAGSIITGIGQSAILMRTHSIGTLVTLSIIAVSLFTINCYALKHLDYY